jgi:hypothetical protein
MAAWRDGERKMGEIDIRVIIVIVVTRERSKGKKKPTGGISCFFALY